MMDDGTMGFGWLVGLAIYFLIFLFPVMQIIHKAGYSRAWILITFVPLVNFIFLWIFALARWPVQERAALAQGRTT